MVFSAAIFIFLFLPVVLFVYYNPIVKNRKFRNIWLLISSIGFYAWGEPVFVLVMIGMVIANFGAGIMLNSKFAVEHSCRKLLFIMVLIVNVGILFIFKYLNFVSENCFYLFGTDILHIALPIGISFYIFQLISYMMDVYSGKVQPQTNILNLGLYVTMFPQLIAGPIVRYGTIVEQITQRRESFEQFSDGVERFVIGLAKKVLLADRLAIVADAAFSASQNGEISMVMAWFGAAAFTLQIYFDFSGYSDMAIGLGKMFGFSFEENFHYPYISKSVTEFWRRWHISLSTWFRDYVYIPLGGNRKSSFRTALNLLIVWILTGLWHGANWIFILWGGVTYAVLMVEKNTRFLKVIGNGILARIYTMLTICFLWVIFKADTIGNAFLYIRQMFYISNLLNGDTLLFIQKYGMILVLGVIFALPISSVMSSRFADKKIQEFRTVWLTLLMILAIGSVSNSAYSPFIYYNF